MRRALGLAIFFWAAFALRATCLKALARYREPLPLRTPFSALPLDICGPGWIGASLPLDDDVEKRARVSAYVQRTYRRDATSFWLYVGYVGQWSPESIHHPDVCFPGSGYELVLSGVVALDAPGLPKESRFKEYFWNHPRGGGTYTLSAFYYNGKLEPEEWRLRWDSLRGIRYFAIVTISGTQLGSLEETRRLYQDVARKALPPILTHFAD